VQKTKTKLVDDLMGKMSHPNREKMVRLAKSGHYHPDTSTLGNAKRQCEADLRKVRYHDLADKVRNGEYD
jgi:hypothetical protein